jgi:hypothetical protein
MVRRLAAVLVVLALGGAVAPCHAARPDYSCYRPSVAPVIDGEVAADPAWTNIPAVTGFSILGDGFTATKQTTAQACWDDQAFYVAVTCEEPDAPALHMTIIDGGNFWEDDGLEIFVQPGGDQVYQFGVTARGAKGAYLGYADVTKFQAAARMGKGFYSIELRVPCEVLHAKPKVGDAWFGNVCRNIWTTTSGGDKFTSWAPLKVQFAEPDNFAVLSLLGAAPEAAQAEQIGARLNEPYRAKLLGMVTEAVARGAEYTAVLDEAARDPQFRARANDLRLRWGRVARVGRKSGQASVWELRQSISSVDALVRESYRFKYAYLIAKLLPDD